ncbi:Pkinase-domain-containing protein [Wolfiporia cocos MD-104 SS10]|uniref:mitogen-activated protein kinase kinase kinase n=1 Tax=Wolfiporia cocos (strain MD-104) TaxID=742152 RepID=A0A2H3J7X8_WOLCO|nr:Pkinase-domain-containing protein [Wolfiporia cocos MD-104 SS10]
MAAVFAANGSLQPYDDPSSSASSPTSPTLAAPRPVNGALTNGALANGHTTAVLPASALEPPAGMSYPDFLRTWSDAHVARWLTDVKCGHHASTFREHDIRRDVLLELDQLTLKEMGIASVGDRLRILNAVKALRQRCSAASAALTSILNRPRGPEHARTPSMNGDPAGGSRAHAHARRLESARPAPLHLAPPGGSPELPRIIRDGQDSARLNPPIRPLPQPSHSQQQQPAGTSAGSTPITAHSVRANLPPLPPPPKGQPPLPPNPRTPHSGHPLPPSALSGRRTPIQQEGTPFSPQQGHASNLLTPTTQSGRSQLRTQSPVPFPTQSSGRRTPVEGGSQTHGRSGSYSNVPSPNPPVKLPPRPSTGNTSHPFAAHPQNGLSPIAESFASQRRGGSSTPPPLASHRNLGNTLGRPVTPSLQDLKKKLVKFTLPDESKSVTINVGDCSGGVEVLARALKKFNKLSLREGEGTERVEIEDGGLSVDGWGAYLLSGQDDLSGSPLTEAQLLSFCQASPDDPSRENGLTLRLISRMRRSNHATPRSSSPVSVTRDHDPDDNTLSPERAPSALQTPATKAMKRASSVSILSGLGVQIPDKELETADSSPTQSPTKVNASKRPSKLRNFFGQRPPSELITTHLAEYFPFTEKKVLERTRRQSMMRGVGMPNRRDSTVSWNAPSSSRFSISTIDTQHGASPRASVASTSTLFPDRAASPPPPLPPLPASRESHEAPRLSLSTDEGTAVDLSDALAREDDQSYKRLSSPHILPPVAFPSESLSESLNLDSSHLDPSLSHLEPTRDSRRLSTASRRMSYITELRSKRDRSDTASLMTVDEITANVESRRQSSILRVDSDGSEEWMKVDVDDDAEKHSIQEVEEEESEDDEDDDTEEGGTVTEDDEPGKAITSTGHERTIKWIKGALIGAGSFGKVYLGMDASTGLLMAVKQVELPTGSAPNEERKKSMLSALEREIELLRELQHENIVQYLSSCIDDDHLNIFLEYVPGGSVTSLLRNYGAFEEPLVRNWVRQILLGLNYLHERDIIHRDIKGANMLVDNKGGIKISDFGISKKVEDNLLPGNRAHRPSLQGSVFWMAPEVVKQTAYTQKADIWSVGCLVVEMLTGEHPWAQLTQMQAIFKIGSSAKPTIPADISPEAENFLQLTFELNHEARPSAAELLKHPWIANQPLPLGH